MTDDTTAFIPLATPEIRGREWEYLKECLDTGWVSSVGTFVNRFEEEFARRIDAAYAVAVSSGTAALHLALLAAGVRRGDLVIVSTLTFIASANAITYVGAEPVLIDAEPVRWQIDPVLVRTFLETACERREGVVVHRDTGRRVAALLPVDLLGHPCDYTTLRPLADAWGLPIVEDATESLGAAVEGRPIGHQAQIACFSFNGNKLITTGGGGMVTTDREDWARHVRHLSTQAKADRIEYVHDEVGYNYRLTNVSAAIGCAQLEQLDEFVAAKRAIARRYDEAFADLDVLTPQGESVGVESARWLYSVRIAPNARLAARDLMARLAARRIESRPLFQPLHLSAPYAGSITCRGEVAEELWRQTLSLPCSVGLTPVEQGKVIEAVRAALMP